MKRYHVFHLALTLLLTATVTVFVTLWLTGVIEVRRHSPVALPDPAKRNQANSVIARLVVLRGLRPNWEYKLFEGQNIRVAAQ
jgi:hypothetical protein